MIKATIKFYGNDSLTPVTIGTGEDVAAPRGLAALEKAGWPKDDNTTLAYKAWLAGKRQGDIPADSNFEDWVKTVEEIDLKLTAKQIEESHLAGNLTREQADYLLKQNGLDSGE